MRCETRHHAHREKDGCSEVDDVVRGRVVDERMEDPGDEAENDEYPRNAGKACTHWVLSVHMPAFVGVDQLI